MTPFVRGTGRETRARRRPWPRRRRAALPAGLGRCHPPRADRGRGERCPGRSRYRGAAAARERLLRLCNEIAPGNALLFLDLLAAGGSGPAQQGVLRDAVAAMGGAVREFPALSRERMESWIASRSAELEISLAPTAARLLAERVGAYVREGDVDRRRMSELANGELEKLALYRPGGTIAREDIDALVAEAVP